MSGCEGHDDMAFRAPEESEGQPSQLNTAPCSPSQEEQGEKESDGHDAVGSAADGALVAQGQDQGNVESCSASARVCDEQEQQQQQQQQQQQPFDIDQYRNYQEQYHRQILDHHQQPKWKHTPSQHSQQYHSPGPPYPSISNAIENRPRRKKSSMHDAANIPVTTTPLEPSGPPPLPPPPLEASLWTRAALLEPAVPPPIPPLVLGPSLWNPTPRTSSDTPATPTSTTRSPSSRYLTWRSTKPSKKPDPQPPPPPLPLTNPSRTRAQTQPPKNFMTPPIATRQRYVQAGGDLRLSERAEITAPESLAQRVAGNSSEQPRLTTHASPESEFSSEGLRLWYEAQGGNACFERHTQHLGSLSPTNPGSPVSMAMVSPTIATTTTGQVSAGLVSPNRGYFTAPGSPRLEERRGFSQNSAFASAPGSPTSAGSSLRERLFRRTAEDERAVASGHQSQTSASASKFSAPGSSMNEQFRDAWNPFSASPPPEPSRGVLQESLLGSTGRYLPAGGPSRAEDREETTEPEHRLGTGEPVRYLPAMPDNRGRRSTLERIKSKFGRNKSKDGS